MRAAHPPHHRIAKSDRFFAGQAGHETSPSKDGGAIGGSAYDVRFVPYLLAGRVAHPLL
jgi:hypothetical protein